MIHIHRLCVQHPRDPTVILGLLMERRGVQLNQFGIDPVDVTATAFAIAYYNLTMYDLYAKYPVLQHTTALRPLRVVIRKVSSLTLSTTRSVLTTGTYPPACKVGQAWLSSRPKRTCWPTIYRWSVTASHVPLCEITRCFSPGDAGQWTGIRRVQLDPDSCTICQLLVAPRFGRYGIWG